jgi:hypothetical protein
MVWKKVCCSPSESFWVYCLYSQYQATSEEAQGQGHKMIFVGYERGMKAYMAYDPVTRRVHVTRDIVFDEQAMWDWGANVEAEGNGRSSSDVFTVQWESLVELPLGDDGSDKVIDAESPGPGSPQVKNDGVQPVV